MISLLFASCFLFFCQVLRWSDFAHTVAPSYMESMHADREKDDMIVVQTRLAADRVMSTGCIVLGDFSTEWVVGATFYYEPELTFMGLLPQRRRWMNGTLAAFIYLVRDDVLVSANARHKPNQTGSYEAYSPKGNTDAIKKKYKTWKN